MAILATSQGMCLLSSRVKVQPSIPSIQLSSGMLGTRISVAQSVPLLPKLKLEPIVARVNRRPISINSSVKSFNQFPFVRRPISSSSIQVQSTDQEIVIALGSNVGNRIQNFNEALHLMKNYGVTITRQGCLYETEPPYVTDQPKALNSAIRGTTKLGPHDLLTVLKRIEAELGRTSGIRYGPRPIDLDILFYGNVCVNSENLTIPHERICERPFVLAPLIDLLGLCVQNDTVTTWHSFANCKNGLFGIWNKLGGGSLIGNEGMKQVLPLGDQLVDLSKKTHVMGILNLTPDCFSDGGKFLQVGDAVSQFRSLISEGADIVDVGAQSTRPFTERLTVDHELSRLIPVLNEIMKIPESEGVVLSVDTFYADVAAKAVSRGVYVINDVSGNMKDNVKQALTNWMPKEVDNIPLQAWDPENLHVVLMDDAIRRMEKKLGKK